jgi:hypothetical protein
MLQRWRARPGYAEAIARGEPLVDINGQVGYPTRREQLLATLEGRS